MPTGTHKILNHFCKYQKIYLSLLLLIILISPFLVRHFQHQPIVTGETSYFHLTSVGETNNPYHLLLSINFLDDQYLYQILPFILAILSLLLLINLFKELKLNQHHQFFFLLFLILSPNFIYTFTVLNHYSFLIFLLVLSFTLLFHQNKYLNYLSFPIFAIISFFDIFSSILTLSLLGIYFYLKKDHKAELLAILIALLTFLNIFLGKPFLLGPYSAQNNLINLFSDFGGLFGLSLFLILLTILGLIFTWKKRKTHFLYPFLIILFALFFYRNSLLIYLNFLIIFFASAAFLYFYQKEWRLHIIKNVTLFLLILGLIFSTLTTLDTLSTLPPSLEEKEALITMEENTFPIWIVLSHPSDSYFVEYFSERKAFLHYHNPDFKEKEQTLNQIFNSTYIKDTFPLLQQNQIHLIYLSSQTSSQLPTDQGLIFLFQNERFKRIYENNNIRVFKFN